MHKTVLLLILSLSSFCSAISQEIVLPPSVAQRQANVPETVTYAILLHQVVAFKDKADELDRNGGDGSPYRRHLAYKFGLTNQQVLILNSVAEQYRENVRFAEQQLSDSVAKYRDANGKLPRGAQILALPQEAKALIANRDSITLHARDQFHSWLGEDEFRRVDATIKSRIASGVVATSKAAPEVNDAR